jgi:catechol 2,3-dioxygenase-like lactoylglutathione lyase family enzyme
MPSASSASDASVVLATTPVASGVHHVGMSVADLETALSFWEDFLGAPARWRAVLDRPYLGRHVGYPGIAINAAFVDLPGGIVLELLEYQTAKTPNPEATANPGNVHLCLAVDDAGMTWRRAVECGARPVVPEGPIDVDGGPNKGARAAYLRIHDGITLELFQRAPAAGKARS